MAVYRTQIINLSTMCSRKVRMPHTDTRLQLCLTCQYHSSCGHLLTDHCLRPEKWRSLLLQRHHPRLLVLRVTTLLPADGIPHYRSRNTLRIRAPSHSLLYYVWNFIFRFGWWSLYYWSLWSINSFLFLASHDHESPWVSNKFCTMQTPPLRIFHTLITFH